jgi:peptide deformylase
MKDTPDFALTGSKIIQYPDPRLSDLSTPFAEKELGDACRLAALLRVTLTHSRRPGIGLAAPQIGVNRCVFILDSRTLSIPGNGVFINPEIVWQSEETEVGEEGCLSFPDEIYVEVRRPIDVRINFFSTKGERSALTLDGLAARAALHETDHLQGITIAGLLSRQVRRKLIRDKENR